MQAIAIALKAAYERKESPERLLERQADLLQSASRLTKDSRALVDFYTFYLAEYLDRTAGDRATARQVLDRRLENRPVLAWQRWTGALIGPGPWPGRWVRSVAELVQLAPDLPVAASWPAPPELPLTDFAWRWRFSLLHLATDLARSAGDRGVAFAYLHQLEQHLGQPLPFEPSVGERVKLEYLAAQVQVNLYQSFGLIDLASEAGARLEQLARQRAEDPELKEEDRQEDFYFVQQILASLGLAQDRPERVIERIDGLAGDPRFEALDVTQRAELELIRALALIEVDYARGVGTHRQVASPFVGLLEPKRFAALHPDQQQEVLLAEGSFRLERGDRAAVDGLLERWRALDREPSARKDLASRALCLEIRRLALSPELDPQLALAELERLEARYLDLARLWIDRSREAAASAFLLFSQEATCLTELAVCRQRLEGDLGLKRILGLTAQLQAMGALAIRLGLDPSTAADSVFDPSNGSVLRLVYLRGLFRSLVLWFDGTSIHSAELAGGDELDRARQRMETQIARVMRMGGAPALDEFMDARSRLEDLLLPPVLRQRLLLAAESGQRVAWVGPQQLGFLPFEVLEIAPGRPVGLELAFEYWPSFAVERFLGTAVRASATGIEEPEPVLLLSRTAAIPSGLTSAAPFILSPDALDPWTRRLRHLELRREEDANLEALVELAPHCRVAWLIAHGAYDPEVSPAAGLILPSRSGSRPLLTTDSPVWRSADGVQGWHLPPIVVLAACGAWRAPQRRGDDGSESLAARCFEAGARVVLLSQHELRFSDHAQLAAGLLDAWNRDQQSAEPLARSLQSARRAAVVGSQDALGRLAPLLFHAYGSPGPDPQLEFKAARAFEFPGSGRSLRRLLGGLLLIAAAGLLWSRRRTVRSV